MNDMLTAKVVYADGPFARNLRDTCHFGRQRAISDLNRQRLSVEMEHDRFTPGTTVYLAVLPDDRMLILNGNHTLEAIAASGRPQWLVLIFKKVADEAEAARLYATFDIHKARTWADALRAVSPETKIPLSQWVVPAVGHIMQDFTYDPRNVEANNSRGARFGSIDPYKEPAFLLQAALTGAPGDHKAAIRRKGVLSVALETLRYQPGRGSVFWRDVALDDGLPLGDPRKTLLRWLLRMNGTKAIGTTAANQMSRGAIAAWNAWYRGDMLQHIRPGTGPIVILGTPWTPDSRPDWLPPAAPRTPEPGGGISDMFDTGVRVTEAGSEPVVLYRKRG